MSIITPPPYGRPDYSAPQEWLFGPTLVNAKDVAIGPGDQVVYGPFNISQYEYIAGRITNSNDPLAITFNWYLDEAATLPVDDYFGWNLGVLSSEPACFHLPNIAPYVQLSLYASSPTSGPTVSTIMYGTNADGVSPFPDAAAPWIASASGASQLGPTGLLTNGGFVTYGYYVSAGNGTATIELVNDQDVGNFTLWQDSGFTSGIYHTVNLVLPYGNVSAEVTTTVGGSKLSHWLQNNVPWG